MTALFNGAMLGDIWVTSGNVRATMKWPWGNMWQRGGNVVCVV